MEQFYVTLPSNASMDIHRNNTKANFKVELFQAIKFDIPYEVALVEISIPAIKKKEKTIGMIFLKIIQKIFYFRLIQTIYQINLKNF